MKLITYHLLLFTLLCTSCAETKTNVTAYDRTGQPIGTYETRTVLYGKHNAVSALFGQTDTTNMDAGFKILAKLFTDLVAAYVAGNVFRAQEATKQAEAAGASAAQIAKVDAAAKTQAAKISADAATKSAEIGAETTGTAIGAGLFQQGGTVFTQP